MNVQLGYTSDFLVSFWESSSLFNTCVCKQQRLLQDYAFQQVYLLSACQIPLCCLICCGYLNNENHFTETILLNIHIICAGLHSAVVDTCLTTDMCLTADPGVTSLIPAWSHDREMISMAILLPSADSRRVNVVVSYRQK